MLQNIGVPGLIILLVIALIIFGPSKLPEIGRAVGRTLAEFKQSARDFIDEDSESAVRNRAPSYQEQNKAKNTEAAREFPVHATDKEDKQKAN